MENIGKPQAQQQHSSLRPVSVYIRHGRFLLGNQRPCQRQRHHDHKQDHSKGHGAEKGQYFFQGTGLLWRSGTGMGKTPICLQNKSPLPKRRSYHFFPVISRICHGMNRWHPVCVSFKRKMPPLPVGALRLPARQGRTAAGQGQISSRLSASSIRASALSRQLLSSLEL